MKIRRMERLAALAMMCCMLFTLAIPSFASTSNTAEHAPIIGVDVASGIVKNVEQRDGTVFLVISSGQEEKVYYISSDREAAPSVIALKTGDIVTVNYALGTPMKYGDTSGFPLNSVTVTAPAPVIKLSNDYETHWAGETIRSAIASGLISGYPDGSFKPDTSITRAEFMTLINKAFKFTVMDELSFSDVLDGAWYHNEVAKAKAAGYISGYEDGTVRPNDPITRQEVAAILFKLKNFTADEVSAAGFADVSAISPWAKGAVGAVVKEAIMKGYPDNTFRPGGALTRAEAVTAVRGSLAVAVVDPAVPLGLPNPPVVKPPAVTPRSSSGGGGSGSGSGSDIATPAQLADQSIASAIGLLPSSYTAVQGTDTNILVRLNGISGMGATGVSLSVNGSNNPQVGSSGTILFGSTSVTGNVTVSVVKANGATVNAIISVTVPAYVATLSELDNQAIAAAKGLIPSTYTAVEGTNTNILTDLNGIVGMDATGVTLSIGNSGNLQVGLDGAITYGVTLVTANVTVSLSKATGATVSTVISVTVPAHILTPAELADRDIASAKLMIPAFYTAVENNDTNLLSYLNGIPGMSGTGVNLVLLSSNNSNVAHDGTITYGSSSVTGDVTVEIEKTNGTTLSKTISVTVPVHAATPEELDNQALDTAKNLIPSTYTANESTDTNILSFLNGIAGMSDTGVSLSLADSGNSQIDSDGDITYGSTLQTGDVTVAIEKTHVTTASQVITVTVPAHTLTQAELANQGIAAALDLLPGSYTAIENINVNLLADLNALAGMSASGVSLSISHSDNIQVTVGGAISYGSAAVTGDVTVSVAKANGTTAVKTISVSVPAHTPTSVELANQAISTALALLPDSYTAIEYTNTNLLNDLNGIPGISTTGVTLSLSNSTNPQVALDGAITYGTALETGNVTVSIAKIDGTTLSKIISVIVPAVVPAHLFIADYSHNTLIKCDADGLNPTIIVRNADSTPNSGPMALAASSGMVYWAGQDSRDIQSSNTDGSLPTVVVRTDTDVVSGIAVDKIAGRIYWADYTANKIRSSLLNGTDVKDVINNADSSAVNYKGPVAVLLHGNKIYWVGDASTKIESANLDGSNRADVVQTGAAEQSVNSLAVDSDSGKIYWNDYQNNRIMSANLSNGSGILTVIADADKGTSCVGVVSIALHGGKLSWVCDSDGGIRQSNLDGTEETSVYSPAAPIAVSGIAID